MSWPVVFRRECPQNVRAEESWGSVWLGSHGHDPEPLMIATPTVVVGIDRSTDSEWTISSVVPTEEGPWVVTISPEIRGPGYSVTVTDGVLLLSDETP